MAGRVGDAHPLDRLAAGERVDVLLRHGNHLAPEPIHLLAVQATGAREQLRRIDQVARAALVDIDAQVGKPPHERARGAGVVEVDVGEQESARWLPSQGLEQRLHAWLRPGVDDGTANLPRADHPRDAAVANVDQSCQGLAGEPLQAVKKSTLGPTLESS